MYLGGLLLEWFRSGDAGPALFDALEEAGWPISWRRLPAGNSEYGLEGWRPLAAVYRIGKGIEAGQWCWGVCTRQRGPLAAGNEGSEEAAKRAAESALRQLLASGVVG